LGISCQTGLLLVAVGPLADILLLGDEGSVDDGGKGNASRARIIFLFVSPGEK